MIGCNRDAAVPAAAEASARLSATNDPPSASAATRDGATSAAVVLSAPAPTGSAPAAAVASGSASTSASGRAAAPSATVVAPALLAADGTVLPQTEDEPTADSPVFQHNLGLLFRAIVNDDPEIARPFFFPVEAYKLVKAINEPESDWKHRLWKLFKRDVHRYHGKLGDDPQAASLVGFEPRSERKKWMKPHSEGNRLGYWRMTRNRLKLRDGGGKEHTVEITSLISWRGQWYVVHLNGFK
jgi:hypothetical protein